jgi:C4-dicarboxylate-specific signal transduction histidine kinase
VGRLAAGLAHEVGNPLAAVLGYMELLEQELGDPALEQDLMARTRKELDRIHRVLRGLLDHAHPGTGEVMEIDPSEGVTEAVSRVEPQAAFQGVLITVETLSSLPIQMAPEKLQQVLVNLMLNAVDAMSESEEKTISWRIRAVEDGTELRCMDSGPGFSEIALDQALEPFFTTKDVGEGTGLGLYTCLQLLRSAGGRISVENRAEGGASLCLWLPAAGGQLEA